MCLEYYPECGDGGDGCCSVIPLIHVLEWISNFTLSGATKVETGSHLVSKHAVVCVRRQISISAHFWDEGLNSRDVPLRVNAEANGK
jgi:hypothetical protein